MAFVHFGKKPWLLDKKLATFLTAHFLPHAKRFNDDGFRTVGRAAGPARVELT